MKPSDHERHRTEDKGLDERPIGFIVDSVHLGSGNIGMIQAEGKIVLVSMVCVDDGAAPDFELLLSGPAIDRLLEREHVDAIGLEYAQMNVVVQRTLRDPEFILMGGKDLIGRLALPKQRSGEQTDLLSASLRETESLSGF